ncbi:hypothetical protein DXT99_04365 [Pontibacter diazotrophicus]|uniref:Uncharacterized protein n=1 Tax=Pontibacter diazotrophicus TaxID=1400979 RepID=A0A3D8LG79_9BACT|nr:hypothetical protein [Pontibacter diazotrophicus]RDV16441.1 hypothetical protein DXT99_04365 [Pontibacter diazotrophicus]
MRKTLLFQDHNSSSEHYLEGIHKSLEVLHRKLLQEIEAKQASIRLLEEKVGSLDSMLGEKNDQINLLMVDLDLSRRIADGNRQLVNKLLNDIDRLQQDVEWYKRTYESRSMLGTLKQKIIKYIIIGYSK